MNTNIDTTGSDHYYMCVKDGLLGSETPDSSFGKGPNTFTTNPKLNQGRGSDCIMRAGSRPTGLNYATVKALLQEDFKGHESFESMSTFLENQIHNHIHVSIGGTQNPPANTGVSRAYGHMTSMFSPSDPIFFLHHGLIDFFWKQWQDTHLSEAERMHRSHDMMNHLLFDGREDHQYPVSDVAMSMDIVDDHPATPETEKACVYYHERKTGDHTCADIWTDVQECLQKVVDVKRLHEVPRIREMTSVGDVCSPLNAVEADQDRIWLENLAAMGMMEQKEVARILKWDETMNKELNGLIPTLNEADASECDKALCFSTSKLLEICNSL
jgi:hypothetical protein